MKSFGVWRNVLLVGLIAVFSFGGSFECNGSSGHDDDDDVRVSADRAN